MKAPPFHLPSMSDVELARGTTGLTVVSTFSGCGGSCLGFEMAGYRVLWANEFVEAARETYAANHRETILDGRDIRQVKPEEILSAIGLARGELDVLNGSPPCASFSSAGRREKGWGQVKSYSDTKQRTDDLFFEFVRILDGLQPRAFVAENVAGLTRGVALGYFKEIMRALDRAGYDVACKILDAQWLGVPQSRARAIFVGVRKDLGQKPEHPKPLPYRYTLRDVLPGLQRVTSLRSGFERTPEDRTDRPAPCIMASEAASNHFLIERVEHVSRGQHRAQGDVSDKPCPTVMAGTHGSGPHDFKVIERVVHDTSGLFGAGDITDRPCPTITVGVNQVNQNHFKVFEKPEIQSVIYDSQGNFGSADVTDKPCPAITSGASGGDKGHYQVRERGKREPRKFTMDELRIICGFPADFVLTGSYGQQWERLGRAVPPPMMRAVAAALRDGLFTRIGRTQRGFFEAA